MQQHKIDKSNARFRALPSRMGKLAVLLLTGASLTFAISAWAQSLEQPRSAKFARGVVELLGRQQIRETDDRFNPALAMMLQAGKEAGGGTKAGRMTLARVEKSGPDKFTRSTFIILDAALIRNVEPIGPEELKSFEKDFLAGKVKGTIVNGALVTRGG